MLRDKVRVGRVSAVTRHSVHAIHRHAIAPGGTFFFTLVTDRRRSILASVEAVDVIIPQCLPIRSPIAAVRDRRHRGHARPSPLHLTFAARRYRFLFNSAGV